MNTTSESYAAPILIGGNSAGSTCARQPQQSVDGQMSKYVDKVPVTKTQKKHWWKLPCIAFIWTGWSFTAVERPL
ncbi:TPA: hypothetical protein ACH3X1_014776 [Trebouxia sp. C0004]